MAFCVQTRPPRHKLDSLDACRRPGEGGGNTEEERGGEVCGDDEIEGQERANSLIALMPGKTGR
jgi:hypothetical protein